MNPADLSETNTLGLAASPYLRQHADNPVHWQQWTSESLALAAARDVPILLSVGYAACHWCHVMAHESFEDHQVADAMNAGFVCVKVDREERPDIDAVYMSATVALTGRGGWPMTCFLTPDGRPIFCGTYYTKKDFLQILSAVTQAWRERRDEVEEASDRIAGELRAMTDAFWEQASGGPALVPAVCDYAVASLLAGEDKVNGGFGDAPKFPSAAVLEALLRNYERTKSRASLEAVERAGGAMARGGIYDQLAGGFARYSVDNAWVVPHFEKMLYDNALLLRAYAHWFRRTGDPLARRVTAETARFLLVELSDADMFVSSLDADADGREGSTYVWTRKQLSDALGDDDGRWAAKLFTVTRSGTFEDRTSVLQLREDPDDPQRLERVRSALLAARRTRAQPGRDDKVVTCWNGLAIAALVEAGVALDEPELARAAARCAAKLLELHVADGRLRRSSLGGVVGDSAATLDDHATLAAGLLALYQVTAQENWRTGAIGLLDTAMQHFADPYRPGRWFDTADDAEELMLRPADPLDGATPSGASSITEALLTAAHLVDGPRAERYLQAASDSLNAHSILLSQAPHSVGNWVSVAELAVRGPLQIAVACDPAHSELLTEARRLAPGGAIVIGGAPDSSALFAGRSRVRDADTAYVCRGRVCDPPVTRAADLAAALGVPRR